MIRKNSLHMLSTDDLIKQFEKASLQQAEARLYDEQRKINRMFDHMLSIADELKVRPGDQRKNLAQLYDHADIWTRLNSVKFSLAVNPSEGRLQLERIANSRDFPAAADAKLTLRRLDEDLYVPD
jgi:hypothetical protein